MIVTDLDGNRFYDLTGSYGVNVLGYDFYKGAIERGAARVRELGPVLGPYHPVIVENVKLLKEISGLDEVSFHMSGTEAVMQAVRLARYHTRRSHLVRFCGAYHGWWGDVQPGIGNPVPAHETYTLQDMSEDTLRVLRTRRDIACVLVNPLQALHPNASAPSDSVAARQRAPRRISTRTPMPPGSSGCARSAPSATSCSSSTRCSSAFVSPKAARRNISACAPISSPTARRWAAGCRSAWCAAATN